MASEDNTPNQLETNDDGGYGQSRVYAWLDDRLDLNDQFLGKAFPEDKYASFLLGEISLFSFVILVMTGTFLGLLYRPGAAPTEYTGAAAEFAGTEVPMAFASVLRITYDVPFGMFTRMVHHWAAFVFIAAIGLHMLRVFFSGAYRNPRELNWMVGATLLFISLGEAVFGYALPFDEYAATATGIAFTIAGSIPFVGETVKLLVFGGEWSANAEVILPRLFFYHTFLIPLIIGGLLAVHMLLLVRQKHTEQKGARDAEEQHGVDEDDQSRVVGVPLVPNQAAVTIVVFLGVLGVIALLAAFFPVQRLPIWGPEDPTSTPASVAPDWYLMWVFGILKIITFVPKTEFVGGVIAPGIIATVLVLWPFIDYSEREVHFTADPIRRPFQTAVGVGAVTLVILLSIAGMNSGLVTFLGLFGIETTTSGVLFPLQILTLVVPIVWAAITYVVLKRGMERRGVEDPSEAAAEADSE